MSYVGSQGRNLPIFIDQNLNPATTTNTYVVTGGPLDGQRLTVPLYTTPRPNANFSQMTQITSGVNTSYNALVLALNRRFTKGLQVQTSYTYSKATDNGQSSQTFTAANNVLDPFNLGLEAGDVELRHPAPVQLQHRLAAEVVERLARQLHDRADHRRFVGRARSRRSSPATLPRRTGS